MALRTLVLTPFGMPHRIAKWEDGVVLVVTGKGQVYDSYDVVCASPSISLQIPAVVRLIKEIHANKKGVKFSRSNVYTRDKFRCCYCGKKFHTSDLNYDHVLPRSRGGKTAWENIVTACRRHNTEKDDRTPAEAGLKMYFQPYKPAVLQHTSPVIVDVAHMPEQWRPWLGQMQVMTSAAG